MANVKFSRKEFEKSIKITKEIEEKISMFGTPLEKLSPDEVEIEIFPNRPDLLSLQGYLRAFLSFIDKGKAKEYKAKAPEKDFQVKIDKSVKDVRPFTACAIVKNLKFNEEKIKEIIDIQEKIHLTLGRNRKKLAIGIYPLEKIKLPITYKALPPKDIKFIPLEMTREMNGLQILSQHPTGREYAHLLEGKDKFPIFVDSNNEVLSMPPIINSHKTGKITEKTKDIFIECSGFDFLALNKTLNILITTLADMGGEVYQMKLVYDKPELTPDLSPQKLKLNIENANKVLGLNLKEADVKKLLGKMGITYNQGLAQVPAYRVDVMHEVDLIEDIAIAYGYENFKPEIPETSESQDSDSDQKFKPSGRIFGIATIGQENPRNSLKRKIAEVLIGLGYLENSSHHLTSPDDEKKALTNSSIQVANSKTDFCLLRNNLFSSALKILGENIDKEYPQKIFEINRIFEKDNNQETGINEKEHMILASVPSNITQLKQELEYLAKMLGKELKLIPCQDSRFIEGRTGEILINNKKLGIIGEVHPQVLKNFHLRMPLVLAELDLEGI
ncbi:MAG: phenylalanine--tRNA ligase subunit beta [Candidatus Pacearchaeota archaeon]|nr:phenylalanine--tRNA ligase subunit beta [Candidatus Pacearchaeota archaeon]